MRLLLKILTDPYAPVEVNAGWATDRDRTLTLLFTRKVMAGTSSAMMDGF